MNKETTMMPYDEEMETAIRSYIDENIDLSDYTGDRSGLEEKLNDDLWTVDSVTGNGRGNYYLSSKRSEQQVETYGGNYLKDAIAEFSVDAETVAEKFLNKEYEYFDVTIRCYLLGQCISEVLDELEENGAFDEQDSEN